MARNAVFENSLLHLFSFSKTAFAWCHTLNPIDGFVDASPAPL
jgi:hypothetical protein